MNELKCSRCDGEMVPGDLKPQHGSSLSTVFRPDGTSFFWSLQIPDVPIEALMCLNCGLIEMRGDVEKVRHLLHRDAQSPDDPISAT